VKGETVTGNGLYKDSMTDKVSNDMTAHLHELSHETVQEEEVPHNPLQNCNSLILPYSNSIKRCLPVDSSHQCPELSVPPQLGKLQKHNSDSGEKNTKIRVDNANSAVSCLSSIYTRKTSIVPASRTVSLPVTANYVLQRAEVNIVSSCVPNSPPVQVSGSAERSLKDGLIASRAVALASDSCFHLMKRMETCIINLRVAVNLKRLQPRE
jgi:hypothetical protein